MRRFCFSLLVAFCTLPSIISSAQQTTSTAVPNLIRYGGNLKNAEGVAIASRTVGVTLAIYKQQLLLAMGQAAKAAGNGGQTTGSQSNQTAGAQPKPSSQNSSPTDKSSSPDKGASPDQAPIESQILAFRALHEDAKKIYDRVSSAIPVTADKKLDIRALVIFDATQYTMIPTYRAFRSQFGILIQGYCGVLKTPSEVATRPGQQFTAALAATGVLGGIQTANTTLAGILDTLKTTTELTSNSFTVPDDALVAEVANLFKSLGVANEKTTVVQVFYPAVYAFSFSRDDNIADTVPTDLDTGCSLSAAGSVIRRLYGLLFIRAAADSLLATLQNRISSLDKAIEDLGKQKPTSDIEKATIQKSIENAQTEKKDKQKTIDQLQGLDKSMDGLITAITKVDQNGNAPLLNGLLAGERLAAALDKPGTYTLELKIQKSGGDAIKKSNIFYGTRFYYGGGSIVSFFLFSSDGAIMSAGNFRSATTYVRDKTLKGMVE